MGTAVRPAKTSPGQRSKKHVIAFVAIVSIAILSRRLKRLVVEELSAWCPQTDT
jgi:hypothetical protein